MGNKINITLEFINEKEALVELRRIKSHLISYLGEMDEDAYTFERDLNTKEWKQI